MATQPRDNSQDEASNKALIELFNTYRTQADKNLGGTPAAGKWGNGGKGIFGHDFATHAAQNADDRQQYQRQAGESMDAWKQRMNAFLPNFSAVWDGLSPEQQAQYTKSLGFDTAGDPAKANTAGNDIEQQNMMNLHRQSEFAQKMLGPLDFNDPETKMYMDQANANANNDARLRGVEGGLSTMNTQDSFQKASLGLQQQRYQMGLNALQGAGNYGQGLAGQNLQEAGFNEGRFQADRNYELQRFQTNAAQSEGLGQTLGSIAGGAVGALGFLSPVPGLGAATMSAGASIGAGIGGGLGSRGAAPRYRGSYNGGY